MRAGVLLKVLRKSEKIKKLLDIRNEVCPNGRLTLFEVGRKSSLKKALKFSLKVSKNFFRKK